MRESLKELSVVDASKLIDRLQASDHRKAYTPPPPDRAARGAIKLASERQRNYIQARTLGTITAQPGMPSLAGDPTFRITHASKCKSRAKISVHNSLV